MHHQLPHKQLVNLVLQTQRGEEITETTDSGIKYSLTTTGLLTYEASNPESVGVHSHQVTITANTTDASASLFTSPSESATLNVTMTITVK